MTSRPAHPTGTPAGYWCELVARSADAEAEWFLGGSRTRDPSQAMAWLRGQATRLADALDPRPGGPFPMRALRASAGPDPGAVFRGWLADLPYQRLQYRALAAGRPVSVNAACPELISGRGPVHVLYSLCGRPLTEAAHVPATPRPAPKGFPLCTTTEY